MMDSREVDRSFFVSKDFLDTLNSLTWFLADAFWMFGWNLLSLSVMLFPIVSGLMLLYIDKRPTAFMINGAINCWIWMNTFWIFSELPGYEMTKSLSKVSFLLGLLFIVGAVLISKNMRETFSHFRRFRLSQWLKP